MCDPRRRLMGRPGAALAVIPIYCLWSVYRLIRRGGHLEKLSDRQCPCKLSNLDRELNLGSFGSLGGQSNGVNHVE